MDRWKWRFWKGPTGKVLGKKSAGFLTPSNILSVIIPAIRLSANVSSIRMGGGPSVCSKISRVTRIGTAF